MNVSTPDIKSAIKSHPDVVGFENAFNAAFSTFPAFLKEELIDRMGSIEISKAETVLSADIFERLKDIPLIDKYAAFQLLDDDWTGISLSLIHIFLYQGQSGSGNERPQPQSDDVH